MPKKGFIFSIVIPTYNRPQVLARTLDCLEDQDCSFAFEIIVVDDASACQMPDLGFGNGKRKHWKLVRLSKNLGRAASRNRGIKLARGRYVLMLDDDIWAEPQLLQAHYNKQKEIGGGVVVGAVPPARENRDTLWNRYTDQRFILICERLRENRLDYGLFLTGNVSIPVSAIREVGGFDETFTEYSFEDSELGLRLERRGLRFTHAEKAIGWHRSEETEESICRKAYQLGRSSFLFAKLHPGITRDIQYHSLTKGPWRGADIAKNLIKMYLFNRVAIDINKLAIELTASLGMERTTDFLITWLRQQYAAEGIKSKLRESRATEIQKYPPSGVRCNLCGYGDCKRLHALYDEKAGRWTQDIQVCGCRRCGHVFSSFRTGYGVRYDANYYIFSTHREKADRSFARHCLAWLEKVVPLNGTRLLDLGCGLGYFCEMAAEAGAITTGIDPGPAHRDCWRTDRSFKYISGRIEDIRKGDEHYDVVTMWDVLEHLQNPVAALRKIYQLLSPDGVIAISVPNHSSIFAKLAGPYWRGYNPYHISHFSPRRLNELLISSGFDIVRMETFDNNPLTGEGFYRTGWNDRLKNYLAASPWGVGLLNWRRCRTMNSPATGHNDYIAEVGRGPLATMLSKIISSWRLGDQIRVIAEKAT